MLWFLLNGVVAALFLLGYAAYYGYPARLWWVEILAVLLPFIAVAALILLLANLVGRQWTLAAVCGFVLVLALIRLAPWQRLLHHAEPSDDDLTLLTFNV